MVLDGSENFHFDNFEISQHFTLSTELLGTAVVVMNAAFGFLALKIWEFHGGVKVIASLESNTEWNSAKGLNYPQNPRNPEVSVPLWWKITCQNMENRSFVGIYYFNRKWKIDGTRTR